MLYVLLALVCLLAFANGANDNSKGVATLVGFGDATPRKALLWAAGTTAVGAIISFWLAGGLIHSFSTGLFAPGPALTTELFIAVLVGAVAWIALATFTGMPVSTTHAITGGLTGAGIVVFGAAPVKWSFLGTKMAMPLALSPLLSLLAVYLISWPIALLVGRVTPKCACVIEQAAAPALASAAGGPVIAARVQLAVVTGTNAACAVHAPKVSVSGGRASTIVHWATSGLVGVARGWNDAPKISALAVGALAAAHVANGVALAFALVTVSMAAGGLLGARKVLETMSKKLTPLPRAESMTASFATAVLVGLASWNGLPVSTTHVSTGAIVGAGLRNERKSVKWRKVGEILVSWIVTLPVAALVAALAALVLCR